MTNPQDISQFLHTIYQDVSPTTISIACRKKYQLYDNKSFVYGETYLTSLFEILNDVNPKQGDVFYDLGSGSGRAVLCAALGFPFVKCIGIELLDELFVLSQTKLELCKKELTNLLDFDPKKLGTIEFINSDFTTADVSNANIIYTASTCFDQKLLKDLAANIEKRVVPGTKIISLTKSLPAKTIKLLKSQLYPMEWGSSTVFFHEKI